MSWQIDLIDIPFMDIFYVRGKDVCSFGLVWRALALEWAVEKVWLIADFVKLFCHEIDHIGAKEVSWNVPVVWISSFYQRRGCGMIDLFH